MIKEQPMITNHSRQRDPSLTRFGSDTVQGLNAGRCGQENSFSARSIEIKSELAKLNVTWIGKVGGKAFIFHFNQDKFASISSYPEATFATVATVTLDPMKKPKRMDLTFSEATGRAERLKGTTQLNIYELDGDTFKFVAPRGPNRPEVVPDQEVFEGGEY